jgi:hypothetical protein
MSALKDDPFLTVKESRAVQRLFEQACQDEACGDAGCENIRRTVGAVKRLLARLAIIRQALDSGANHLERVDFEMPGRSEL